MTTTETATVTVVKHKCVRCDHEWQSRVDRLPKCCPKCKSYYWQVPRKGYGG